MSWISSVLRLTCPRCRQGEMFEKPMNLRKPLKMHKQCSVCGQRMEPEAGFYYGAMFVSYVFIAMISLLIAGTLVFYFNFSIEVSFGILIAFLALIFLWNLRFARSLWAHIIIKHDKRYKE
jgi:uncharacterized protein (DUF983 family)